MKMLRQCLDPRVLVVLVVVGAAIAVWAPGLLAAATPILFLAVCLSPAVRRGLPTAAVPMLLMMRAMGEGKAHHVGSDPRDAESCAASSRTTPRCTGSAPAQNVSSISTVGRRNPKVSAGVPSPGTSTTSTASADVTSGRPAAASLRSSRPACRLSSTTARPDRTGTPVPTRAGARHATTSAHLPASGATGRRRRSAHRRAHRPPLRRQSERAHPDGRRRQEQQHERRPGRACLARATGAPAHHHGAGHHERRGVDHARRHQSTTSSRRSAAASVVGSPLRSAATRAAGPALASAPRSSPPPRRPRATGLLVGTGASLAPASEEPLRVEAVHHGHDGGVRQVVAEQLEDLAYRQVVVVCSQTTRMRRASPDQRFEPCGCLVDDLGRSRAGIVRGPCYRS